MSSFLKNALNIYRCCSAVYYIYGRGAVPRFEQTSNNTPKFDIITYNSRTLGLQTSNNRYRYKIAAESIYIKFQPLSLGLAGSILRLVRDTRVYLKNTRVPRFSFILFFFNDTATTEIYTLSLHDALPIWESF